MRTDELVRRAQRGDPRALAALVDELLPYAGRICGAVALDAGDDALQETMVAIIRNIGSLRDPAALRGWVRRIAVREAVRAARAGAGGVGGAGAGDRRTTPIDPAELDAAAATGGTAGGSAGPGGGGAGATVPDGATAVDVRAVLAGLAPEQRAVLVLRHVEGLHEDETAVALGVAPGTVKSRLHRARAAFRTRWTA